YIHLIGPISFWLWWARWLSYAGSVTSMVQGIWMAEIREILIPKTWFAGYRSGEVNGCSRERRTELKTRPQLLLSVLLGLIAGAPAFAQKYKTISRRRSPFLIGSALWFACRTKHEPSW